MPCSFLKSSIVTSALAAAAIMLSGQTEAAIIRHVITIDAGDTSGGGIPGALETAILDITLDTALLGIGSGLNVGLRVNNKNFELEGGLLYENPFGPNTMLLHGALGGNGIAPSTNDVLVYLENFATITASVGIVNFSQADTRGLSSLPASVVSTEVNPVPLPGGLPLFAAGLGIFAVFSKRTAWRGKRLAA